MRRLLPFLVAVGCSSSSASHADLAAPPDLSIDKAAHCTDTFGTALTAPYGRLDGTVLAVLPPAHPTCPRPNMDHMILEVLSGGAAYRMVVNVQSDRGSDLRALYTEKAAAFTGWADGWHTNVSLDYVRDLGVG